VRETRGRIAKAAQHTKAKQSKAKQSKAKQSKASIDRQLDLAKPCSTLHTPTDRPRYHWSASTLGPSSPASYWPELRKWSLIGGQGGAELPKSRCQASQEEARQRNAKTPDARGKHESSRRPREAQGWLRLCRGSASAQG